MAPHGTGPTSSVRDLETRRRAYGSNSCQTESAPTIPAPAIFGTDVTSGPVQRAFGNVHVDTVPEEHDLVAESPDAGEIPAVERISARLPAIEELFHGHAGRIEFPEPDQGTVYRDDTTAREVDKGIVSF